LRTNVVHHRKLAQPEVQQRFPRWAPAFIAVEQPLIGNAQSLHASISDHFLRHRAAAYLQAQTLPETSRPDTSNPGNTGPAPLREPTPTL